MKLRLCRAYGAIFTGLLLAIVGLCLFGQALDFYCGIFRELQAALLSVQWMLLACIAVWCGIFTFLTFNQKKWPLLGLLLIAIIAYFIDNVGPFRASDAIILLTGVTLGMGTSFALLEDGVNNPKIINCNSAIVNFLVGLVGLLAFSAWWHLDMAGNYHGPRWMGLWNNPNFYGMLMSTGVVLAIGMLAGKQKEELRMKNSIRAFSRRLLPVFLFIAAGVMAVGLMMSYSRGSWLGATVGLAYLAWSYGQLKWRYVLPGVVAVTAVVFFFWGATSEDARWYVKRMDLGRPSAQHRVAAWRGALEMMRDHPFGVGWNNAVTIYEKNYSPPENGAAAITTNDYLMLGTQLGWPGLICFVTYVALCFRNHANFNTDRRAGRPASRPAGKTTALRYACRAGALTLLVAFWFDGGLFTLATAAVFWILLELGGENAKAESGNRKSKTVQQSEIGN